MTHSSRPSPASEPVTARRGLTLVELMIGLVVASVVSMAVYRVLLASQRAGRIQTEHAALQDNVRAGALIVSAELRELGFDSVPLAAGLGAPSVASSDILLAQPGRIRYRAMRGLGFTCAVATVAELRLQSATFAGLRLPLAGIDSVSIFVEGDGSSAEDDAWIRAAVAGVSNGSCAGGEPAIVLSLAHPDAAVGSAAASRIVVGGPVRAFEVMELQYYRSDGRSWLGMRSVSRGEVVQPLIGPLADSAAGVRGLTLAYLDRDDRPTAATSAVRAITVDLRGVTDQPIPARDLRRPAVDTLALTARVTLRNSARP